MGEIYVRNNTYANEDVIGAIETFGGEAWMLPSPTGLWLGLNTFFTPRWREGTSTKSCVLRPDRSARGTRSVGKDR